MATGDSSVPRPKSVKGSDLYFDFPCLPCEKEGKNVGALKYCEDCQENLCGTCLSFHNKLGLTKQHKVLDKVTKCTGPTTILPSQKCSKHAGKSIEIFCPKHNDVGCTVCMALFHSACVGKQFIPDVASGIKYSKELIQLEYFKQN